MKRLLLQTYWLLTRAYLRVRGADVGRDVRCNGFPFVKVRKGGRLVIGDGVMINATRWANAHVVPGSMTLYVHRDAELRIGNDAGISGTRLVAMKNITIGAGTLIGAGCLICDSDMHEVPLGNPAGTAAAPISVGERVFIGAGTTILKGVVIGDGSVVGAGSVVSRNVPPGVLASSDAAKIRRSLF